MEDGSILDSQITASSFFTNPQISGYSWAPDNGRLNQRNIRGGWCAAPEDTEPWLQIDLQTKTQIEGVITKGGYDSQYQDRVTAYKVQYSDDQDTLHYYIKPGTSSNGEQVITIIKKHQLK